MPSLSTLSRLTASTLLVTAAACAADPTQGARQAQAAAAPTEPGTDVNSTNAPPPTLDLQMTSGTSAGAGYSIDAKGTGFPPGKGWDAAIMVVLPGNVVVVGGGGGGVNPADGSFRMIYSGHCPSRFLDVYAYVISGGRTTESKHIVPTC